jgi:hypothetical protein
MRPLQTKHGAPSGDLVLEQRKTIMRLNKPAQNDHNRKAINGLDKHCAKVKSIPLNGTPTEVAEMKQLLRAAVDATATADAAHAEWRQRVAQERAARADATRVLRALRSYVLVHYGAEAVAILADFGFSAPKPTMKSVRTTAAAADKSLATRAARHTMGSKQREHIKGEAPAPPPILPPVPVMNGAANGAPA